VWLEYLANFFFIAAPALYFAASAINFGSVPNSATAFQLKLKMMMMKMEMMSGKLA
jgi:hypothetical protein